MTICTKTLALTIRLMIDRSCVTLGFKVLSLFSLRALWVFGWGASW